jgi:AcrR family transcriptional regulator
MKPAKTLSGADKTLSRRKIAETALGLVRAEGAAALSARRLASLAGCEAMSLYHYFKSMDDVLDEVVDLILEELAPAARAARGDPEKVMLARARRYLAVAMNDPGCFRLIATRRWTGPAGAARAQEMMALAADAGVPGARALAASRAIGAYLNGAGLALAAWSARGEDVGPVRRDLDTGLKSLVSALIKAK